MKFLSKHKIFNRYLAMIILLALLLAAGSFWVLYNTLESHADTTATLLPTADGNSETDNAKDEGNVACDTTDCYDSVDETSGASCTTLPSDGDTTLVKITNSSGDFQDFDIDESSVSNNYSVTSV